MPLSFIVTGTPRSGTVFMARLLTSFNVPCGHEAYFHENTKPEQLDLDKIPKLSYVSTYNLVQRKKLPKWVDETKLVADSSYLAAPLLNLPDVAKVPVIHVVRNPLKVISSIFFDLEYFQNNEPMNSFEEFIYVYLPQVFTCKTKLERVCEFWMGWNKMIRSSIHSPRPYLLHQIESGPNKELIKFLKCNPTLEPFNDVKINSWNKRTKDFTLDDIPENCKVSFLAFAREMGYLKEPKMI
jgi:hypothetical protein